MPMNIQESFYPGILTQIPNNKPIVKRKSIYTRIDDIYRAD